MELEVAVQKKLAHKKRMVTGNITVYFKPILNQIVKTVREKSYGFYFKKNVDIHKK